MELGAIVEEMIYPLLLLSRIVLASRDIQSSFGTDYANIFAIHLGVASLPLKLT